MDVALTRELRGPSLSPAFDARVLSLTGEMDAEARAAARRRAMEEEAEALSNLELGWRRSLHRLAAYLGVITLGTLAMVIALDVVLMSVWPLVVRAFPDAGLSLRPDAGGLELLAAGALVVAAWLAVRAKRGLWI